MFFFVNFQSINKGVIKTSEQTIFFGNGQWLSYRYLSCCFDVNAFRAESFIDYQVFTLKMSYKCQQYFGSVGLRLNEGEMHQLCQDFVCLHDKIQVIKKNLKTLVNLTDVSQWHIKP